MLELRERISVQFYDESPHIEDFAVEVLAGLKLPRKTISPKFFYDRRGSELFEKICTLPEYYPTRTEMKILRRYSDEMAKALTDTETLVEYGSGASEKVQRLLDVLPNLLHYVSIDISKDFLLESSRRLARHYPSIQTFAISADYSQHITLPSELVGTERVVFFPGSTIGNLAPVEAQDLLSRMGEVAGPGGKLLIGVDLVKDVDVLEAAYNDSQGVTRDFNLNLLQRINREAGADFDLDGFRHFAFFNQEKKRIEMHLVSKRTQTVTINDQKIFFDVGETIHTENSHKYSIGDFHGLAGSAGWRPHMVWTDENRWFGVFLLEKA